MRPEDIKHPAEAWQINHPEDTPAQRHDAPDPLPMLGFAVVAISGFLVGIGLFAAILIGIWAL